MLTRFFSNASNQKYIVLGCLSLFILSLRIITFREFILDIDELEWLYVMRKCIQDPRPFIGFTAGTSGPFSVYLLTIIHGLTGFQTISSIRIINYFFFIIPTLVLSYASAKKGSKTIAAITFTAFITHSMLSDDLSDSLYAYNTEYQVVLVVAILMYLLRRGMNNFIIPLYAFLVFALAWIKIQALPLAAITGILCVIQCIHTKQYRLLLQLVIWYFVWNGIWLGYLYGFGMWDEFVYAYIQSNLNYINADLLGPSTINPLDFFTYVKSNYESVFIYILLGCYGIYLQRKMKNVMNSHIMQSFLLVCVASTCIIIAKNNFHHYYILLFYPISLLVGDIFMSFAETAGNKENNRAILAPIFICLALTIINFKHIDTSVRFVANRLHIGNNPSVTYGQKMESRVPEETEKYLIGLKNPSNTPIICLGWFDSSILYYKLRNHYTAYARNSSTFYFKKSFENKNWKFFRQTEQRLKEDILWHPPTYIVDTWGIVNQVKGTWLNTYVHQTYTLTKSFGKVDIYERKTGGM